MSPRKPGRPAAVPAARVVEQLHALIAGRAGHPCPSREAMAAILQVDEHVVRRALRLLEDAGELQIQHTAWIGGLRRRMRVKINGRWCRWTDLSRRHAYDLKITAPDLLALAGDSHHVARVLAAGRY